MSFFNLIPSKASTQLNSTFFFFFILTPNSLNHSSWSVPRYNYPEQTRNDLLFFTNLWCYLSFILHLKASSILSFSSLGGLCKCVCERDCVCVCVCLVAARQQLTIISRRGRCRGCHGDLPGADVGWRLVSPLLSITGPSDGSHFALCGRMCVWVCVYMCRSCVFVQSVYNSVCVWVWSPVAKI